MLNLWVSLLQAAYHSQRQHAHQNSAVCRAAILDAPPTQTHEQQVCSCLLQGLTSARDCSPPATMFTARDCILCRHQGRTNSIGPGSGILSHLWTIWIPLSLIPSSCWESAWYCGGMQRSSGAHSRTSALTGLPPCQASLSLNTKTYAHAARMEPST
jgi:hypothetical protein